MKRLFACTAVCACLLLCSCENGGQKTSIPPINLIVTGTSSKTEPPATAPPTAKEEQTEEPAETAPPVAQPTTEEPTQEEPTREEPTVETTVPETTTVPPAEEPHESASERETGELSAKEYFSEDLFIGDSISTGLYLYDKLNPENVAASVGNTPRKAYTTAADMPDGSCVTPLEYAAARQPKRIFILLGSNGMASSQDTEAMKGSYRTLVEKLQSACPDSRIYCLSVTPVTNDTRYTTITNDTVREFNSYLSYMCSELGLRYLDLYSLLSDEDGCLSHVYAEQDGVHFKGSAYDVMLRFIQNELS